jgi:hypothetical protein
MGKIGDIMMVKDNGGFSQETIEALTDDEFARAIKYIAMDMGADATLGDVREQIEALKPLPTQLANGVTYTAGYKGPNMIAAGSKALMLVDIIEKGKTVKFMFVSPSHHFIYHTMPKENLTISDAISLSKKINSRLNVHVHHEVIEATGEYHATVADVDWDGSTFSVEDSEVAVFNSEV